MARRENPLYNGIDPAPAMPAGRDSAALGPSDSTDSGSDVAGLEYLDDDDPALPADAALDEDNALAVTSIESVGEGVDSDAAGTGERRSAGSDAGRREAADIDADRIVPAGGPSEDERDVADLAGGDADRRLSAVGLGGARSDDEQDDEDEEDLEEIEDEAADPVGEPRGRSNLEPEEEAPAKPGR